LRLAAITGAIIAVTLGCSVFARRNAEKPPGTHYSAAFLTGGGLVVFPFDGEEVTLDLPSGTSAQIFSADGNKVYGFARSTDAEAPPVVVASIIPPSLTAVEASRGLRDVQSIAADADGGIVAVTGVNRHYGVQECGVFELDVAKATAEHIVNNPSGECFDFVSLWNQLSLSPDGSRLVGRAGKGQLGLISLREHRVEKQWPGAAAWWSPDGRWIAALTYESPAEIDLIRAGDLSIRRKLGHDTGGRLQWSPDSRYLLLLDWGACGVGSGYFGTLKMLDIESGERTAIKSSTCKVNHSSVGWVSDDVLK
jgi:hypothetical protein